MRGASAPCMGLGFGLTACSATAPSAGVEGAPSGGGRATYRRWAKGAKRLAHNGWAGANTTDCAQRLTGTPCGFGAADTALTR